MKKIITIFSYVYASGLIIVSLLIGYLISQPQRYTALGSPFTYIQVDFTQRSSLLTIFAIGLFILGNVLMLLKKEYKS